MTVFCCEIHNKRMHSTYLAIIRVPDAAQQELELLVAASAGHLAVPSFVVACVLELADVIE